MPVSSSGHLVISEHLLGVDAPGVTFEIWLHLGTLLAVLIYFCRRLLGMLRSLFDSPVTTTTCENRQLFLAIIIGTIPAAVIGFLLKDAIEAAFSSPRFAAAMLVVTGLILLTSRLTRGRKEGVTAGRGFVVGIAQALAILPGISRSGSTITCGMLLGVDPALAAEFSFLLSIPAIGGAFILDLLSSSPVSSTGAAGAYLIGTLTAGLVGYLSIHYLLKIVRKGRFHLFGLYCLVAGVISFIFITG